MNKGWKCLESRPIFKAGDGKTVFIDLCQDKVKTQKGEIITYTKYYASDVVIVVPFIDHRNLLMIKQFRYPVGKVLLEFPAGHVEEGEDPLDTCKRELAEETGYRARKMECIYEYHPAVGRTRQSVHVFRATGLDKGYKIRRDSGEQIRMQIVSVKDLHQLIERGKVNNAGTLIAYLLCCLMKIRPADK